MISKLYELQNLQFAEILDSDPEARIASLRSTIPATILAHYDRLCVRGKRSVALAHDETCGGCHMHVTRGKVLQLRNGADICFCDSCGRYLHLPDATTTASIASAVVAAEKSVRKSGTSHVAHAR